MPIIHRSLQVPYTVSQMYQLVNDVASYPQFLPWCKSTQILSASEDEIRATLVLAGGGMQKAFTTCNRLQKDKMIEIRLIDGPFHNLQGFWRFDELSENQHCQITLDLEFEFANKLIAFSVGPVFNHVANTLVDAFSKRAVQVYGK